VAQLIGTVLSGRPAACLDWVNYTGGSEIIQLGHCGMGICGQMASGECRGAVAASSPLPQTGEGPGVRGHGAPYDAIVLHPVIRQGGGVMGPVHVGQFEFGPKTGLCLTRDPDGRFKLLAFTGRSDPQTARGLTYSAVDMAVADPQKLNRLVLDGGFPHHLAVALGDVTEEVRMLSKFLGVEYLNPAD